jgi:hypothetical protein
VSVGERIDRLGASSLRLVGSSACRRADPSARGRPGRLRAELRKRDPTGGRGSRRFRLSPPRAERNKEKSDLVRSAELDDEVVAFLAERGRRTATEFGKKPAGPPQDSGTFPPPAHICSTPIPQCS